MTIRSSALGPADSALTQHPAFDWQYGEDVGLLGEVVDPLQQCGKDLVIRGTARVTAIGWGSENCAGPIASLTGPQQTLSVLGGSWLLMSPMTGANYLDATDLSLGGTLKLDSLNIDNNTVPLNPKPKLKVRSTSAGGAGQLTVINCPGISLVSDVDVVAGASPIKMSIDSMGYKVEPFLLASGEGSTMRAGLTHLNAAIGTQNVRLTYFTAQKSETITRLRTTTGNTAATSATVCQMGVYSEAANGALTLVAYTANDTTLWAAAYTHYTKTLSSSWTKVAGQRYATAALTVTTGASPNLIGPFVGAAGVIGELLAEGPRVTAVPISAYTALPATIAATNLNIDTTPVYTTMLP